MQNKFSTAAHWPGQRFDEAALEQWLEDLRARFAPASVSLGLIFIGPQLLPHAEQILELCQVRARIPILIGCSGAGLIAGGEELEEEAGLVLALYHLPDTTLHATRFTQRQVEECSGPGYWHMETGLTPDQINGWLVFADPFHLDSEAWLRSWNEAYAPLPIVGGLASNRIGVHGTQLYLNGKVHEEGGVAVAFSGRVRLASVISQGCTPIGETWTITRAQDHFIHEIGNQPAFQVLAQTFNNVPASERDQLRGNLFVGLVINEYLEDFHRGDFLIRNLIGADPKSGALAVGALPRPGQTLQFQRRDAASATEDMEALLDRARQDLEGHQVYGACLCSCNGRGRHLFGHPNHDAAHVQRAIGPIGLAGFFCNGEIGPVGERNFLHGYTASLAVFIDQD